MKNFLLLVCMLAPSLHAAVIFDNADTPQFTSIRTGEGVAAYLHIGSSDVTINQIGINIAHDNSGQLKFLIFDDVAPPGSNAGPVLLTDTVDVAASSNLSYALSDQFSVTLQANRYYDIGAIFNGGDATYSYDLLGNSMNGISSIPNNQNIGQFSNPLLTGHALSDIQIRLFANATTVPEPGTAVLACICLLALGIVRSRLSRNR